MRRGHESAAFQRLRESLGLTPAQAAGAVGALTGESGRGLSPIARNPTSGAIGIGQWLGARAHGVRPGDFEGQLNHLIGELKGPERAALDALRRAKGPREAAEVFTRQFERPSEGEIRSSLKARQAAAVDILGSGGGGGGTGGGGVSDGTVTIPGTQGAQNQPQGSVGVLPLLEALSQQQAAPAPSTPLQTPSFAAAPVMPAGAPAIQSGGGPASPQDFAPLLAAIQTAGGDVAHAPGQDPMTLDGSGMSVGSTTGRKGGHVVLDPNADRAGVHTHQDVIDFARQVSAVAGLPVRIGTGTRHSRLTVDGNVSEHWSGNAGDIPATGRRLITLGQAALIAAGMPEKEARKQTGGLYNVNGYQVIFNTQEGGDHTNHLHVGVGRAKR